MSEFELDQESVSHAERLTFRLMDAFRMFSLEDFHAKEELFSEQRYSDEAGEVPLADVLANCKQLASEFVLVSREYGEIPCLKLGRGEMCPMSLRAFFGLASPHDWMYWADNANFGAPLPNRHLWQEFLMQASRKDERFVVTGAREAVEGVGRNLAAFLSYRFAGMKKWNALRRRVWNRLPRRAQPAVASEGGLKMQVSCSTRGLRIHVSPAYFIDWVYFGSPTTPVTSFIRPGRYVFAGDGPMLPLRTQDDGVFCIPPTYHAMLTRF